MTDHHCQRCGGPVLHYAGSIWGWTCRRCIDQALGIDGPPPGENALPMLPGRSPSRRAAEAPRDDQN